MGNPTNSPPPVDGDEPLTEDEVKRLLKFDGDSSVLARWRWTNTGPPHFKAGKFVRYWRSDVMAWLGAQKRSCEGSEPRPTA